MGKLLSKPLDYRSAMKLLGWLSIATIFPLISFPSTASMAEKAETIPMSANSSQLLEQGINSYQAGRFQEAIELWQRANRHYQHQNDDFGQASSFNYLSLAWQKLGQWQKAEEAIDRSLQLLEKLSKSKQNTAGLLAQVYNTQGSLQLALGKTQTALKTWQEAEKIYSSLQDEQGTIGAQINQVQALQSLGLYRRSQLVLEKLQTKLHNQTDSLLKINGLRSLGITLQVVGDLDRSQKFLQQSLAIAQKLQIPDEIAATLFSLGNTARASENNRAAIDFYQQTVAIASSPILKLQAQLNQLRLLISQRELAKAEAILPDIKAHFVNFTPSRETIYQRVNFAESLMQIETRGRAEGRGEMDDHKERENPIAEHSPVSQEVVQMLTEEVHNAQKIQDSRAETYALGTLAKLYERQQKWLEAKKFTEEALQISEQINAADISYQWQWQLGRILKAQNNITGAIAAKTEAVKTLQRLRKDLVAINPDVQFSFRDSVEPVYRELVALLLQSNPSQSNLKKARETIESLQLAELENFFREACLHPKSKQIDRVDPKAAVIYPIILEDRLAVIVSLRGKPLIYYETHLSKAEIEKTVEKLLQSLNPIYNDRERLRLSQQVYNWLIEPVQTELANYKIKTLVFVPDGLLRNLPMAALYDGKQYLVEKYGIALTPGLQLLEPKSLKSQQLNAVIAGISQSSQGFAALPGVQTEVKEIATAIPSKLLLDVDFTQNNFQTQLQQTAAPIVHLATHGQFSSDPNQTYILTWSDRIKVKDFEDLLRSRGNNLPSPIELMVLSACQTASGDKRAALGMAGMAVRSGARSTLATLWSVQDQSTSLLMTKFYQKLVFDRANIDKAEALRQAQLDLIKSSNYHHPFYWSAFILVGNWL